MKIFTWTLILASFFMSIAVAQTKSRDESKKPLTLASQGSFFVGGEYKTMPANGRGAPGEITINQMYVQYQIPVNGSQHVPVVMVHGCCLSSKTWETTPDGRMGWNEYFVRKNRSVYLADQSRAPARASIATSSTRSKRAPFRPASFPTC